MPQLKTALITGAFGQDGIFMQHYLARRGGYKLILAARSRPENLELVEDSSYEYLDINDFSNILSLIKKYKPDELYHFASFSAPVRAWEDPPYVIDTNGTAMIHILEAIRLFSPRTKVLHASSAKIFGRPTETPQNENTKKNPTDPYSLGKYLAHQSCILYRTKYNLFCSNAILYNHESHFKTMDFVARKICYFATQLKKGKIKKFDLLNLYSRIDLGDPRDYVEAMHLILQQKAADDYIISTNTSHSVGDVARLVFEKLGIAHPNRYIDVKDLSKPKETNYYRGDNTKLLSIGWKPKYSLDDVIESILAYDKAHVG